MKLISRPIGTTTPKRVFVLKGSDTKFQKERFVIDGLSYKATIAFVCPNHARSFSDDAFEIDIDVLKDQPCVLVDGGYCDMMEGETFYCGQLL